MAWAVGVSIQVSPQTSMDHRRVDCTKMGGCASDLALAHPPARFVAGRYIARVSRSSLGYSLHLNLPASMVIVMYVVCVHVYGGSV